MAYTAPHTIVSGELVSVATMNNEWGGNIAFLANPPACRVYHNTTQSLTDNAEATVAFNGERYDTASMHDNVTNNSRITFNTAGLYLITFNCEIAAANDYASYYAYPRLNGATVIGVSGATPALVGSVGLWLSFATVYKFAAADYVEVRILQNNTASAARNILSTAAQTPEFSATWIGIG